MRIAVLIILMTLPCLVSVSQDIHFSQYYFAPVFTNPANTGLFEGKYRMGIQYRNQWNAVTTPFKTLMAAGDMMLIRKKPGKGYAGAGLMILGDRAGDGAYGITQAAVSLSWFRPLDRKGRSYLGAGFSAAPTEVSVNFNRLRFPDQYDGSMFNPNIPHGESIGREWDYYPDLAAGLIWHHTKAGQQEVHLGLSAFHLNRPKWGLLESSAEKLSVRWSAQAASRHKLSEEWHLAPSMLFNIQDRHRELLIGSNITWSRWDRSDLSATLRAGLHSRLGDAMIILLGADLGAMSYNISYDINYSGLKKASYLRGGLELSLQYTFLKPDGTLKREVTCPIF